MALPAWAVYAGIKGLSTGLGYLFRGKTPDFESTEYGRRLKKLSKTGVYDPSTMRKMLGRVSRVVGSQAQRAKADIRGRMAYKGYGGSVAAERALAEPGVAALRTMGEASTQLEVESALSKKRAKETYEELMYKTKMGQ